jgi:hypothetical protein
LLHVSTR